MIIDSKLEINDGTKYWKNQQGHLHRENGPAFIWNDGSVFWYINNRSHRIDGPADVYASGRKSWYLNEFIREFRYD